MLANANRIRRRTLSNPVQGAGLLLAFWAFLSMGSCAHKDHVLPPSAGMLAGSGGLNLAVHRVYAAAFDAVEAALEADELPVAQSTLNRLGSRLAIDKQTAPTLAQARIRDDEIAIRTLSGELPSAESVAAATRVAEGFGRIIGGRERVAAIELSLELERLEGTEMINLVLVAKSSWPEPLVLRQGLGGVEVLRVSLEPRTGVERRESRTRVVEEGSQLRLTPGKVVRATLLELPIEVPVGAIATRMEALLYFNAGSIAEDGRILPMRKRELPRARRIDLAGWVPKGLVDPIELAELVARGGAPLPALLERAVRIAPSRKDETLDRLGRIIRIQPMESFRPIVPALRWIVGTNEFGRDARLWRDWLIERYEARAAAGRAIGG